MWKWIKTPAAIDSFFIYLSLTLQEKKWKHCSLKGLARCILFVSFTLFNFWFLVSVGKLCSGSMPCLKADTCWVNVNERKYTGCDHTTKSCVLNVWLVVVLACSTPLFCCSGVRPAVLLWWLPLLCLDQVHHLCLTRSVHSAQVTCRSQQLLKLSPSGDVLSFDSTFTKCFLLRAELSSSLVQLPLLLRYLPLSWGQCKIGSSLKDIINSMYQRM